MIFITYLDLSTHLCYRFAFPCFWHLFCTFSAHFPQFLCNFSASFPYHFCIASVLFRHVHISSVPLSHPILHHLSTYLCIYLRYLSMLSVHPILYIYIYIYIYIYNILFIYLYKQNLNIHRALEIKNEIEYTGKKSAGIDAQFV